MMDILPFGDTAVLVNFEQEISLEIHQQVLDLRAFLMQKKQNGILSFIPAYASLTIIFDPSLLSFIQLTELILGYENINNSEIKDLGTKTIPICFDPKFALDLNFLEEFLEMDFQEIIDLLCNKEYSVFQLGFLPGFAYLGTLDPLLECPRKSTPKMIVPAQSLAIAGAQAGIYPSDSPGGWQIIGKTPINVFDLNKKQPFFFEVGNRIRFEPISLTQFKRL